MLHLVAIGTAAGISRGAHGTKRLYFDRSQTELFTATAQTVRGNART